MYDRVKLKKAIEALLATPSVPKPSGHEEEDESMIFATSDESPTSWTLECLDARADEIDTALASMQYASKYCCRVVSVGDDEKMLAVVASSESRPLTRQLSAKVWASIRLQATLVPPSNELDEPSLLSSAVKEPRLEFKPGYEPQHTTVSHVVRFKVATVTPTVAEALAAADALEALEKDEDGSLEAKLRGVHASWLEGVGSRKQTPWA
jgi:hypothetical protein